MAIVCSTYHSTRDLHWDKETRCFSAEMSTLQRGLMTPTDGRVYDDACDVGFILISHKTGDAMLFVLDHEDMNGDEVAGYVYKATQFAGPSGKWLPVSSYMTDITALLIND
jgi:hypothetical protein